MWFYTMHPRTAATAQFLCAPHMSTDGTLTTCSTVKNEASESERSNKLKPKAHISTWAQSGKFAPSVAGTLTVAPSSRASALSVSWPAPRSPPSPHRRLLTTQGRGLRQHVVRIAGVVSGNVKVYA